MPKPNPKEGAIVRLLRAGRLTRAEIAEKLGVTRAVVNGYSRRRNLKGNSKGSSAERAIETDRKVSDHLKHRPGATVLETARATGIPKSTVRGAFVRLGLITEPPPEADRKPGPEQKIPKGIRYAQGRSGSRTCQWIYGDPRNPRYCGAETVPGSSWCPAHHEIVFRKVDDAELEEAV